jgi:hypothetical protein
MFWKNFGLVLAKIGKVAFAGALWASQHPEVVSQVASVAGHPEVAAVIGKAAPIVEAVAAAKSNG